MSDALLGQQVQDANGNSSRPNAGTAYASAWNPGGGGSNPLDGTGKLLAGILSGMAAGTAAAAMRGGKFTVQQVATDAFGNAIGNSIVDNARNSGSGSQQTVALKDAYSKAAYAQIVGAFGQSQVASDRTNDVLLADARDVLKLSGTLSDTDQAMYSGIIARLQARDAASQAAAQATSKLYRSGAGDVRGPFISDAADTGADIWIPNSDGVGGTVIGTAPDIGLGSGLKPSAGEGMSIYGLGKRFGIGLAHGALDIVWQPIAQTIDIGQAAWGYSYNLVTGGIYEPKWLSGIGQNYANGMSYGETILRGSTGIPVAGQLLGVGLASYDLGSAAQQGDWGGVAEGLGGVVGGGLGMKYVQRGFAPEAGAELGIYRARPKADITNPMVDPGNLLRALPGDHAQNFITAQPVYLGGRSLYRVFDNVNAHVNGGYWGEKVYSRESSWRSGVAVPEGQSWNNGTMQGEWQPNGGWGWGGKAAPQAVPKYSTEKWGFTAGWIQRGGDYQIWIPDSRNAIPSGVVTSRSTPWSKP
jgi:hypothetical protein